MKLDMDSFPISRVKLEHKKILVHTDQAKTTKNKSMVIFDDLRNRMIKPRKSAKRVKPTSAMLIKKY
jgi:hypothetical protein